MIKLWSQRLKLSKCQSPKLLGTQISEVSVHLCLLGHELGFRDVQGVWLLHALAYSLNVSLGLSI